MMTDSATTTANSNEINDGDGDDNDVVIFTLSALEIRVNRTHWVIRIAEIITLFAQ